MKLDFNLDSPADFNQIADLEWLETNGLGGYASATVAGSNSRRYHGILIAATQPPVGRVVLLSKLEETVVFEGEKFELSSNQYPGSVFPKGYAYLKSFSKNYFPEWIYKLPNGVELKKTIAAIQGENTTIVIYEVVEGHDEVQLDLLPLVSGRDFHSLGHANWEINQNFNFKSSVLEVKPYNNIPELFISAPDSDFYYKPDWYYSFEYLIEQNRGSDFVEDLFSYGKISVNLKKGIPFGVIVSTENPEGRDALALFSKEEERRKRLTAKEESEIEKTLALAADQFIVKRGPYLKTIIAGYPWFSDWGRDTMIALPGLCLSIGRYDDARKILSAFARSISKGMLPNRFPDYGEAPEYNTVDATLWFFIAIKKYLEATKDKEFVLIELLPILREVIHYHLKGTRFNIKSDKDGFLSQGEEGQQLTWMDAKVGDWVVTPRIGLAVEVTALWYNALSIYAELLLLNDEKLNAKIYTFQAKIIKDKFTDYFWNEKNQCLYDFIKDGYKDDSIRPNQLFAISLPHPLIEGEKAKSILKIVSEKLYTPFGLRSLSLDHSDYKGYYGGNQTDRDGAYHQGTVWSWLLGPYVDAIMKVKGEKGKAEVKNVIENISLHFNDGCIGNISEIFDGEEPHTSRGCIAQAWSIGELLRVIKMYKLSAEKKGSLKKELVAV